MRYNAMLIMQDTPTPEQVLGILRIDPFAMIQYMPALPDGTRDDFYFARMYTVTKNDVNEPDLDLLQNRFPGAFVSEWDSDKSPPREAMRVVVNENTGEVINVVPVRGLIALLDGDDDTWNRVAAAVESVATVADSTTNEAAPAFSPFRAILDQVRYPDVEYFIRVEGSYFNDFTRDADDSPPANTAAV